MMPKYFCQISRLLTIFFFLWCSTSRKDQENLKENVEKSQNNKLSQSFSSILSIFHADFYQNISYGEMYCWYLWRQVSCFLFLFKIFPFCTFPRLGKVLRKIVERENVEKSDILSTYIFSNITNYFPFLIKKLNLVQSGLEAQPLHEYYMWNMSFYAG